MISEKFIEVPWSYMIVLNYIMNRKQKIILKFI